MEDKTLPRRHQLSASLVYAIMKAWIVAGSLDILLALAQYYLKTGKNVKVVLKYIASAVYGKTAYSGGDGMVAMGLLFHFIIAFTWTLIYFLLYPRITWMAKNNLASGIVFALGIWLVMNWLVLPMSRVPALIVNLVQALPGIIMLIIAVGLPLSFFAHRYYSKKEQSSRFKWPSIV